MDKKTDTNTEAIEANEVPEVDETPETVEADPEPTTMEPIGIGQGDPSRPVRGINDTRGTNEAVLGHFVDVVSGPHAGRYGVLWNVGENGQDAVVRTRDEYTDILTCDINDLRPAQAGRR